LLIIYALKKEADENEKMKQSMDIKGSFGIIARLKMNC